MKRKYLNLFILMVFFSISNNQTVNAAAAAAAGARAVPISRAVTGFPQEDRSEQESLFNRGPVKKAAEIFGRIGAYELGISGYSLAGLEELIKKDPAKLPRPQGSLIAFHGPDGTYDRKRTSMDFIRDYLSTFGRKATSLYVIRQAQEIKEYGMHCYYTSLLDNFRALEIPDMPTGFNMFRAESEEIKPWLHRLRREYTENPAHELMEHVRWIAQEEFWAMYNMKEALQQNPTTWTAENFSLFHMFNKIPDPVMKEIMRVITLDSVSKVCLLWDNFLQHFTYNAADSERKPSQFIRWFYKDYFLFRKGIIIEEALHSPPGFTEEPQTKEDVLIFYSYILGQASMVLHSEESTLFGPDPLLREGIQAHLLNFGIDKGTMECASIAPIEERRKNKFLTPNKQRVRLASEGLFPLFALLERLPVTISKRRETMVTAASLYDRYFKNPSAFGLLVRPPAVIAADAEKADPEKSAGGLTLEEESSQKVASLTAAIAEINKNLKRAIREAKQKAARVRRKESAAAVAEETEEERKKRIEEDREQAEKLRAEQAKLQKELEEKRKLQDEISKENARLTEERRAQRARSIAGLGGAAAAAGASSEGTGKSFTKEETDLLRDSMPTARMEISTKTKNLIDKVIEGTAKIEEIKTLFQQLRYVVILSKEGFRVKYTEAGQDSRMKNFHREHDRDKRDRPSCDAAMDLLRLGGYID
tara:strand:+ start:303 stop:2417 length:2115 start_codon:yes stop_codon:yes gene_type:complete